MTSVGVIGGGLAGLTAAIALARAGLPVTLLEASDHLGGCCATTTIEGYTFNDGALFVALPEVLARAYDRLGMSREARPRMRPITALQATTLPSGQTVQLGWDAAAAAPAVQGVADEAAARADLANLMRRWEPLIGRLTEHVITEPFSLPRAFLNTWRHLPQLSGSVADTLRREIRDPALRATLAGATLYSGLAPTKAPSAQILGLIAMLSGRVLMPEGGMGRIPAALTDELRGLGGDIRLQARVEAIHLAGGSVRGVSVARQGPMLFDALVCTVSGMATCMALLPAGQAPAPLMRRARSARLSQRAISVQLGLSNQIDASSHFLARLPLMERQHDAVVGAPGTTWLSYTAPTVTLPELAPANASLIEAYPGIAQDRPVDAWTDEEIQAIAEATIGTLRARHDLHVAVRRVRGPRHFRDQMGLYEGAIYGLSPAAGPGSQFPHRTPIGGLFLAGQTTWPGYGVGPAMLSGLFAADELLREQRRR